MTNHTLGWSISIALICGAVIAANRRFRFDPSIGETHPRVTDHASYPKEYVHFATGLAIGACLLLLGAPYWSLGIVAIATLGYEWSQRFMNYLDVLAGCGGLFLAYLCWQLGPFGQ